MRKCKLLPKTQKLKQRIKQYGDSYIIVKEAANVPCLGGRGFLILSDDRQDSRWVKPEEIEL